jgi:hypothetical protein
MLTVETYLASVEGKGIGLFARSSISRGDTYWVRNTQFDKFIAPKEFETYTDLAKGFIRNYGFQEQSGMWYLCIDNARFVNHDPKPNTFNHFNADGELLKCTAIVDIEADGEILCDYRKTCITCEAEVGFEVYDKP